jgi:general secretion pathway protein G
MLRIVLRALVVGSLLGLGLLSFWLFGMRGGEEMEGVAKAAILSLTNRCNAYYLHHGDWPPSLDALAQPQPNGDQPFVSAAELLDPWNHPYGYDPAGPHNNEMQPDIWAQTPQGKVVGNWPGGH